MKHKIYLLPLALLSALILITWGCEKEEEEDVCEIFDITAKSCDPATICCPLDGGNCYIVNPEGEDFYCDADAATETDPEGCDAAYTAYIEQFCPPNISKVDTEVVKKEIRAHIRKLMEEARTYSVCN